MPNETENDRQRVTPLTTYYVPIKENLGFRFVVWPTNLSIEKVSKNLETMRWDRLQSMNLTRRSVEFLATRAGSMLEQWDVAERESRDVEDGPPNEELKDDVVSMAPSQTDEVEEIKSMFDWK